MAATTTRFHDQVAPCGHRHDGERSVFEDLQGLITEEVRYACGCRRSREEFHDGSVHRSVMRHDGEILEDEEIRGE